METSAEECSIHKGEFCVSFCKSCDCLVCLTCILSPDCHQGHTCTTIQEITTARLNEAVPRIKELKSFASDYKREIEKLSKSRKELDSEAQDALQMIASRTQTLRSQLDLIENDLTTKVQDFLKSENTVLSDNLNALETDWNKLTTLIADIESYKDDATSLQKSDLKTLLSFYSFLKTLQVTYQPKQVRFADGKGDSLKTLVGDLKIETKQADEHEYLYLIPEPVRPPATIPSITTAEATDDKRFTLTEDTGTKGDKPGRDRLYSSLVAPRPVSLEEDENLAAAQTYVEEEQIYYDPIQLNPVKNKKLSPKPSPKLPPKHKRTSGTFVDYTKDNGGGSSESIQNTGKQPRPCKKKARPPFVKLKSSTNDTIRLHTGSDETIWLSYFKSREIKQIKVDGSQTKKLQTNFDIYDFTVNTHQEVSATENDGQCVYKSCKSTFSYKWTKFCQFEPPLKTYGICLCTSSDDSIFVCLQRSPLAGQVVKLSKSGTQLLKYEYGPNREVLFVHPDLIVQNPVNEDLCVVDGSSIVVISKTHSVRYSWSGHTPQNVPVTKREVFSEKAAPTGLDVDTQGNLYVSDYGNSRVSVFDKEGQFVKVIRESLDHVTGITIDNAGFLWIAAENMLHTEDINVTPL